jgi:uncharacterized protein with PIN domain
MDDKTFTQAIQRLDPEQAAEFTRRFRVYGPCVDCGKPHTLMHTSGAYRCEPCGERFWYEQHWYRDNHSH